MEAGGQPAEGTLEADLPGTSGVPSQDGGCGPLRFLAGIANSRFKMQDSKFRGGAKACFMLGAIPSSGRSLRKDRTSGSEMRAFAGRSSGPHGPNGPIPTAKPVHSRADGLDFELRKVAALRPGAATAAAGCCAHPGANSEFNIQNSELRTRGAACGARTFGNELRASAAPRLRPARPFRGRMDNIKHRQLLPSDA